jgi:hypothetical protein
MITSSVQFNPPRPILVYAMCSGERPEYLPGNCQTWYLSVVAAVRTILTGDQSKWRMLDSFCLELAVTALVRNLFVLSE